MTHKDIWQAIDNFAFQHNMSCSGLARFSGLDATTFNKSKRTNRDGAPHWPSTYTIACVLNALNMSLAEFATFMPNDGKAHKPRK